MIELSDIYKIKYVKQYIKGKEEKTRQKNKITGNWRERKQIISFAYIKSALWIIPYIEFPSSEVTVWLTFWNFFFQF